MRKGDLSSTIARNFFSASVEALRLRVVSSKTSSAERSETAKRSSGHHPSIQTCCQSQPHVLRLRMFLGRRNGLEIFRLLYHHRDPSDFSLSSASPTDRQFTVLRLGNTRRYSFQCQY